MPFRRTAVAACTLALLSPVVPAAAAASPAELKLNRELPRPIRPQEAPAPAYDPHSVLVRFKPGASAQARDRALTILGARTAGTVTGTGFVRVRATGAALNLLRELRADPAVQSASLDYRRQMTATPNDLFYTSGDQNYLKTVRLPAAWDVTKGSTSQIVAVVDTGVNGVHADLRGRTVGGYNAITNTSIAVDANSDDNGHGSMVAGIAAANTGNGIGVAGAAWTAKVMPIKVLDSRGSGYDSDIAEGVIWAANRGAKIINMSLGGPGDSQVLHDAVTYATGKGAVVVVAAGNTASNHPQYPAAYPEVLAVGATDTAGNLTDFSSWGDWVDLAAPGFGIVSAGPGQNYYIGDGTSFAAPIVSGAAVLVRTRYPNLTPAQVIAQLRTTARDNGPRGIDPYYGYGVLDAYRAVGGLQMAAFPMRALGSGEPNDVPARATPIVTSLAGTMPMEGDVDWYRYESTAQKSVQVRVTPPAFDPARAQNFDPILAVYDPQLRLLGEVDSLDPGAAESLTVSLGVGTYYVAIRNYNGAPDTRSYSLSVTQVSATVGPTPDEQVWVRDVTPADFAVGFSHLSSPRVTFQRAIDPASVTAGTVRLVDGRTGATVPTRLSYDAATKTVTLKPLARLGALAPYRIVIGAVRDQAGAVHAEVFTTTFQVQRSMLRRTTDTGSLTPPARRF